MTEKNEKKKIKHIQEKKNRFENNQNCSDTFFLQNLIPWDVRLGVLNMSVKEVWNGFSLGFDHITQVFVHLFTHFLTFTERRYEAILAKDETQFPSLLNICKKNDLQFFPYRDVLRNWGNHIL